MPHHGPLCGMAVRRGTTLIVSGIITQITLLAL
ncbi:MAG: hypothetical protein ACLUOI_16250 [Eisenbergiella sp.]